MIDPEATYRFEVTHHITKAKPGVDASNPKPQIEEFLKTHIPDWIQSSYTIVRVKQYLGFTWIIHVPKSNVEIFNSYLNELKNKGVRHSSRKDQ